MKFLAPAFSLAVWSLYVWLFDPLHIQDKIVTNLDSFWYWTLGAVMATLIGFIFAHMWEQ